MTTTGNAGRKVPEYGNGDTPKANASECYDCSEVYGEVRDDCPANDEHVVDPLYVTKEALGYDDDQDYYHFGRKRYEYPARF